MDCNGKSESTHGVITMLNGLPRAGLAEAVESSLPELLALRAVHHVRDEVFAPCQGCFECWLVKPGECKTQDAANQVMRELIAADVVVYLTKPAFGCGDAHIKAALDRSIGLALPFFYAPHGETHHLMRYARHASILVIAAVGPDTSAEERTLFELLVARNALNMHAKARVVFAPEDADRESVRASVHAALESLKRAPPEPFPELPASPQHAAATGVRARPDRPRHAVLWVGSAKPKGKSTSERLGAYLTAQLEQRGWTSEVVYAAQVVKFGHALAPELVEAVRRADLLLLAAPVYIDCLPALVLDGLKKLAGTEWGDHTPALLPIVQCGFPELTHTALAVEVAALAARRLGLGWAGHLALGGGAMLDGRSLASLGARFHSQVRALARAAQELDEGLPISSATADLFASPAIPAALYRLGGNVGWLGQALRHRTLLKLWKRPFRVRAAG